MHPRIRQITIHGYKLIGTNGAGKSSFIGLFRMLRRMMSGELTSSWLAEPTSSCTKATEDLVLNLRG